MSREINCKAVLKDNAISCNASLGQTVIVTEGPETYTGPVTVTPTETEQTLLTKDKLLTDNVTVNPIPSEYVDTKADYDNALTAFGVESDLADGITALTEYSNEITGEQNTNLSDAVRTLADGYQTAEPNYDEAILPSEYQRVEYIESTGEQYINLPIGFYPTDEIHMMGAIPQQGADKFMVCASQWNTSNNRFGICGSNNGKNSYAYGSASTGLTITQQMGEGNVHKQEYANGYFWSDTLKAAVGTGGFTFGAETSNIRLFFGYRANTIGKIRYYVHKKADETGVALYACYRKSDGEIGLYDIDNDVFYTNDGTGTFTKGSDI